MNVFHHPVGVLHGGAPAHTLALTNDLGTGGRTCLGIVTGCIGACEMGHQIAGQCGAMRGEIGVFGGVEVIHDDELAPVVAGQNQIRAGLLKMSGKQEASIIDLDMIRSRPAGSR
jgi:hypothetical protein